MIAGVPDPRTRPYEPRGAARDLFYCRATEVLMDGPAGTGKSRALLEKGHGCLLKYAGARALAVRKTRKSMTDSVLVTFEEKVLPVTSPLRAGPSRPMRQAYHYPNGSELVIGGMDSADKIMSTEYDLIMVFEATELSEDDLEKLTTRLRNGVIPYQQLLADCNPSFPHHWLNQRCNAGRMHRLLSRHEDNPSVTPEYLNVLRALSGARRARLYEGRWASQEGLVYDGFDASVHVIDQMPEGWEAWKKYRVIDFGFTNPFVCQWWAEDPDGRLYLYREIYWTKRLVEDHAREIASLSEGWGLREPERYTLTLADHDAEDRATLNRHGVPTTGANKAVTPGIQSVQARLRIAGDGKPRIFFLGNALVQADPELVEAKKPYSTVQEFDSYVWPKGREGKPEKEEPVKEHDHGCLIAGTLVETIRGLKPIESIREGDEVLTRAGFRRVLGSGLTQQNARGLITLNLSTGKHLTGTGDHPVYVVGKGYTPLRSLRYGDILLGVEKSPNETTDLCAKNVLSRSRSKGLRTGVIQMRSRGRIVCISSPARAKEPVALADFIKRSGRPPTGAFQRGTKSTTSTEIRSTTTCGTLSASPFASTDATTQPTRVKRFWRPSARTCAKRANLRGHGTALKRGDCGTQSNFEVNGSESQPSSTYVDTVESTLSVVPRTPKRASVLKIAGHHRAERAALMTRSGSARCAGRNSWLENTPRYVAAPAHVVSVCAEETQQDVFNLTVDGEVGEFFANGILVHNCDAMRYLVYWLDAPRRKVQRRQLPTSSTRSYV